MFAIVLTCEIALSLIIMLVPGISNVFSVYYCKTEADRCFYDDGT